MKWVIPQHQGISLIDWLKTQRNVLDPRTFFTPTLEDLRDPFEIFGMVSGVDYIIDLINQKKKIYIHGDFDADGITATSIVWLFFYKYLKADIMPYIPSRFHEGYGLTNESITKIIEQGAEAIITVDCGIRDIELIDKYHNTIDFLITDHHTPRQATTQILEGGEVLGNYLLPARAKALIHPLVNRKPEDVDICGAFVAFKLCSAINIKLGLNVDMREFTDLCCIGTVCDVMPLVGENRTIVKLGLERINKKTNVGLNALTNQAKIKDEITSYHIGYVIGPRLNAAGRLGDALDAVRLLTTSSKQNAEALASKLEALNSQRRSLTDEFFQLAEKEILLRPNEKVFMHFGEAWPEGLLGLIAGKLTEKYNKPVIIGSKSGVIKASARSPEFFNIIKFLENYSLYLEKFGGHSQAAGLTVKSDGFEEFSKKVIVDSSDLKFTNDEKILYLDASLENLSELSIDQVRQILSFEPFGNKNPKPTLHISGLKINKYSYIGARNEHIKFDLVDSLGLRIEAINFGNADYYSKFLREMDSQIEVAASVEIDNWNNYQKVTLRVIDMQSSK